jgi:hypothetical protein
MTPNSLRSFAIGLLVAATVTGAVYIFGPSEAKSTEKSAETVKAEKPTEDEMIEELTSKGFVIQTEDEWNKQLAATADKKAKEKEEEQTDQKIVYRTVLTVSLGMTSIDVGNALEQANIIESGLQFYKEIEKRGLENELKPGTFKVESEMTMDEIISVIFK